MVDFGRPEPQLQQCFFFSLEDEHHGPTRALAQAEESVWVELLSIAIVMLQFT